MNFIYDIDSKVERFHWWFVGRRKLLNSILKSLNLKKNTITIDAGCGVGSNLKVISESGLNVIGIDNSLYALSIINKELNVPLLCGDINMLPLRSNSVGIVIAMDILEHLENDSKVIKEIYRVLKRNGVLFLTVPAFNFLWGLQDKVSKHKRRYTKKEIISKLTKNGFKVSKSSYFNFFLFFPIFLGRCLIKILNFKIRSENEINYPIINFYLKVIFSLEPLILNYFSFPFGVSIFCVAKK